jgi:hypothetical protein
MSDKARAERAAADGARLLAYMAMQAAPAQAAAPPVMIMPGLDAEPQWLLQAAADRVNNQADAAMLPAPLDRAAERWRDAPSSH